MVNVAMVWILTCLQYRMNKSEDDNTAKCTDMSRFQRNRLHYECLGCRFDTSTILGEDELEPESIPRGSVDETDRYFYVTILAMPRDNGGSYIPFK